MSKNLGMKSFPETGNFAPSFDSASQILGLVPSSSSLLQQMSASLQSSSQAMSANSASAKFPELSITKHEPRLESQELQIIQKRDTVLGQEQRQSAGEYICHQEADIHEQIHMLQAMPDFIRMKNRNIQGEEAEASGEEIEDEENNIGHKVGKERHLSHLA